MKLPWNTPLDIRFTMVKAAWHDSALADQSLEEVTPNEVVPCPDEPTPNPQSAIGV